MSSSALLQTLLIALPLAFQEGSPGFARMEEWSCPPHNQARFLDYVDEVWSPLFDQMVQEGLFTAWSSLDPAGARAVEFRGEETSVVDVEEGWTWTGFWQGGSQETFTASWREYHRRLEEAHPGLRGPEAWCTKVRISTYALRNR